MLSVRPLTAALQAVFVFIVQFLPARSVNYFVFAFFPRPPLQTNDPVTNICQAADKQLFTLVEWAKRIPHFSELPLDDQVILLRAGGHTHANALNTHEQKPTHTPCRSHVATRFLNTANRPLNNPLSLWRCNISFRAVSHPLAEGLFKVFAFVQHIFGHLV